MSKKKQTNDPEQLRQPAEQSAADTAAENTNETELPAADELTGTVSEEAAKEITAEEDADTAEDADTVDADAETDAAEADAGADDHAETAAEEEPQEEFTLKMLLANTRSFLASYQLPELLLPRFLSVYFLLSGFFIVFLRHKDRLNPISDWKGYVEKLGGAGFLTGALLFIVVSFLVFSMLSRLMPKKWKIVDQSFGVAAIMFFDCAVLWRADNFFLTTAVAFVSLVFINYLINKLPEDHPYERVPWTFSGLLALGALALVTFFVIAGTVAKHKIFGTACHDFGLFVQMFHSLATTLRPITTCERDAAFSHFCVHASYIYYLLVPFYKAFPKESTLLAAQAILAMGGAIPMFLIAKRRNFKGISLAFITFTYIFSLGIVSPCFYDFHENAFLPTLLMWLFFAIDAANPILFWIMTILVCIVKEDAPLYIMCIGLYLFFNKKETRLRLHGIIATLLSSAYMIFIIKWLTKNGDGGSMTNTRFGILMTESGLGLGEVIKNVVLDPAYFFSLLIHEDTLNFFLKVMLPLLFLPFLTKKIHRFWLMVPFIVMNLVIGAGYGYAANIEYQYIFGPICLLFYMTFLNLEDLGEKPKQKLAVLLGSAAIIFFVGLPLHYWDATESYKNNKDAFQELENVLDSIPQDASVYATPFFVAHIAEREEVYLYDFNDTNQELGTVNNIDTMDFFVIGPNTEIADFTIPILEEHGYTLFGEVSGRVKIYKNPAYTG